MNFINHKIWPDANRLTANGCKSCVKTTLMPQNQLKAKIIKNWETCIFWWKNFNKKNDRKFLPIVSAVSV